MCGCPPHLVEAAASVSMFGPVLGAVVAAVLGGKFGQMVLRVWNRVRGGQGFVDGV